jgi:transposase
MKPLKEAVMDKGYHSNDTLHQMEQTHHLRVYISEPKRGRRKWKGQGEAQQAVYANRRRIQSERGLELLRKRGELVERSFAHVYETGGMRRTHLREHQNILKRLLIHAAGFNLSLILRRTVGVGTARGMQDRAKGPRLLLNRLCKHVWSLMQPRIPQQPWRILEARCRTAKIHWMEFTPSATGC